MQAIKVKDSSKIPSVYTGIAEWDDGSIRWYLNGKLHREDGPAIEHADGSKFWYFNGTPHQEDGPARIWADGAKEWILNGNWHREDGPAIETADGSKTWFLNGKYHREDGPACEYADGGKSWYLKDKFLFRLPSESQPFIFLEEFFDEEDKQQIKVLTQQGIEIWPNVPGLKELAENWSFLQCK